MLFPGERMLPPARRKLLSGRTLRAERHFDRTAERPESSKAETGDTKHRWLTGCESRRETPHAQGAAATRSRRRV
jgi:hypothetical protein